MLLRLALFVLLTAAVAAAQTDARADVRAALEEQAPLPSRRLVLPQPTPEVKKGSNAVETHRRVAEAARLRADEATRRGHGQSLGHPVQGSEKDAPSDLGQAGQAATGQARAEEVRKNSRGGKPPRPPRP